MTKPIVYGPTFSTYVRSVRMAFIEKGQDYELVHVDMLAGEHKASAHLARHPFGKVPALAHGDFALYETDAILRYVDEALPGARLQPQDPRQRARMNQAMALINAYAYPAIIGQVVLPRFLASMQHGQPDETAIAAAVPQVELCLKELERIMADGPWLAHADLSLADLLLAPIYAYLTGTPEARVLQDRPGLQRWWGAMSQRVSLAETEPKLG